MPGRFDWLNDPQRQPKITGARLNEEFNSIGSPLNVRYYNVLGNGSDETTKINDAFAGTAGRSLFFPEGEYVVSGLNAPATGTRIIGENYQNTVIKTNSATATVLPISNPFVTVENLNFQSSVTRSAGWYIDIASGGDVFRLSDFYMDAPFEGIRIQDGAADVCIQDGQIVNAVVTSGVSVRIGTSTGVGPLALAMRNVLFNNPSGSRPFAHLVITNCGDLQLLGCQLINASNNVYIAPDTGQVVVSLHVVGSFIDMAGGINLSLLPTGSGTIARCTIVGSWISSAVGANVQATSGASGVIDEVSFTDCNIFDGTHGISASGAGCKNLDVSLCAIADASSVGINLVDDVASARIIGNRIGSTGGFGVNATGIVLANATDHVSIIANDLRNNTTILTNTSSGANHWIANNKGYNPVGPGALTPGASPWTYTAGPTPETIYLSASTSIIGLNMGATAILPAATAANENFTLGLGPNDVAVIAYTGTLTAHRMRH